MSASTFVAPVASVHRTLSHEKGSNPASERSCSVPKRLLPNKAPTCRLGLLLFQLLLQFLWTMLANEPEFRSELSKGIWSILKKKFFFVLGLTFEKNDRIRRKLLWRQQTGLNINPVLETDYLEHNCCLWSAQGSVLHKETINEISVNSLLKKWGLSYRPLVWR